MTDQSASPPFLAQFRRGGWINTAVINQRRVLHAMILHDIKARFYGTGLGYFITMMWPIGHMAIIFAVHTLGAPTPYYGTSNFLFVATGLYPFIVWNYTSRFTMTGPIHNRPYLSFPVVTVMDALVGRLVLEVISMTFVGFTLGIAMMCAGINIMPQDLTQAALGMLSALLLGIGTAFLAGVMCMIWPLASVLFIFFIIGMHFTSGVLIPIDSMPRPVQNVLWYNPLVHVIDWIRVSYWSDYPAHILSKTYVIYFGLTLMTIGLAAERLLRKVTRSR